MQHGVEVFSEPVLELLFPMNSVFVEESPKGRNIEREMGRLLSDENRRLIDGVCIADFLIDVRIGG